MKNKSFFLQTEDEKRQKLVTVLRSRTCNALTPSELHDLTACISIGRQYDINVYSDPAPFCAALSPQASDGWYERGRVVMGQVLPGHEPNEHGRLFQENRSAAVIMTRKSKADPSVIMRSSINIYIPKALYMKGAAAQ